MIERVFLEHPRSVDEGYFEHMGMAFSFGGRMIACGVACLVHGFVPALFKQTASTGVTELYDCMCVDRDRGVPQAENMK